MNVVLGCVESLRSLSGSVRDGMQLVEPPFLGPGKLPSTLLADQGPRIRGDRRDVDPVVGQAVEANKGVTHEQDPFTREADDAAPNAVFRLHRRLTRQQNKKPHWVEGGHPAFFEAKAEPDYVNPYISPRPIFPTTPSGPASRKTHTHTGRKKRTGEVESEFGGIREVAWRVRRRLVEKPVCV
jgi:hypothetical protein